MVALLVVLTFIAFVALDFYLEKRSVRIEVHHAIGRAPPPLRATIQPVPAGVFLQPTWTWSRIGESGELYVGIHPMLLSLVGAPVELDCRVPGERIAKGEPLARLGTGGKRLTVRSPVEARVELVNYPAVGGAEPWAPAEGPNATWLYRLTPEHVATEIGGWLTGEPAAAWTRRKYGELRNYLQGAVADRHLGAVMADGGELPVGILGEMDERVWSAVDERLMYEAGAGRAAMETTP